MGALNKTHNPSFREVFATKIILLVIAEALLLAGCVTMTAPVQVGKDTYMIGVGARGGFSSDAELLAKSIKTAGEFCASLHRSIEVQNTNSHGVQGWTPQSNEVVFKCVSSQAE